MKTEDPQEYPGFARRLAEIAVSPRQWPRAFGVGLRLVRGRIVRLWNRSCVYGSYCRSLLRRRSDYIEERWRGHRELAGAPKVAVFNHYDRQGVVHDFVAHYIRQLTETGFAVVFVSNSPQLPQAALERLLPSCALVLRRANVGYDFGAFKDGIGQIPALDRLDTLLLANDSVYGPFRPLREVVARMDPEGADVWGITDSWEYRFHLQSFFLLFGRSAIRSTAFSRFWSSVRYIQAKEWVIERYEIGLTAALTAGGLRCRALIPYRPAAEALLAALGGDLRKRIEAFDPVQREHVRLMHRAASRGVALNGMHYFWDFLIERQGCPFLKRELLRDNPMGIPFAARWREVVGAAGSYDTGLIARHLAATQGDRPVPDPMPEFLPRRSWYGEPAGEGGGSERVQILLAVYNGCRYLPQQLDSLLGQRGADWSLLARDDGSTDGSRDLLLAYQARHPDRITVAFNDRGNAGTAANFSALLERSTARYLMLCDQDDLWLPDKVEVTLGKMKELERDRGRDRPLLVHTDLKVTDGDLRVLAESLWRYQKSDPRKGAALNRLLVQNCATGCSVMINRPLRDLATPIPEGAVMHDWWLALIAAAFGGIGFHPRPTLLYRQHGANDTGAKRWGLRQVARQLAEEGGARRFLDERERVLRSVRRQAAAFLGRYQSLLSAEQRTMLEAYATLGDQPFLRRKWRMVRYGFFHTGLARNLAALVLW